MVTNKEMNSSTSNTTAANNANDSETKFDPAILGREFVRQYYTMLNEGPENLFRFYGRESFLIHGNSPDEEATPIKGADLINKKILSLNFKDCHTKIRQVDSLETSLGNVVIQVIGELSNNGQPMRRFFQTFVLCRRNLNHYYVKNDIFRYTDDFGEEDEYEIEEKMSDAQLEQSVPELSDPAIASISSLHVSNNELPSDNLQSDISSLAQSLSLGAQVIDQSNSVPINSSQSLEASLSGNNGLQVEKNGTNASLNGADSAENYFFQEEKAAPSASVSATEEQILPTPTFQDFLNDMGTDIKRDLSSSSANAPANTTSEEQQIKKLNSTVSSYANMVLRSSKMHESGNSSASVHIGINNFEPSTIENNTKSSLFPKLGENISSTSDNNFSNVNTSKQSEKPTNNSNNGGDFFNFGTFSNGNEKGFEHPKKHSDEQQVFVGNLPQNVGEDELTEFFSTFGPVIELRINRANQKQGKAPNYGFVTFQSVDAVKKILAEKPVYMDNHRINVEEKRSQGPRGLNGNSTGFGRNSGPNRGYNGSGNGSSGNHFSGFMRGSRDGTDRGPRNFGDKRKTGFGNSNGGQTNRVSNDNFNNRR